MRAAVATALADKRPFLQLSQLCQIAIRTNSSLSKHICLVLGLAACRIPWRYLPVVACFPSGWLQSLGLSAHSQLTRLPTLPTPATTTTATTTTTGATATDATATNYRQVTAWACIFVPTSYHIKSSATSIHNLRSHVSFRPYRRLAPYSMDLISGPVTVNSRSG